MSRLLSLTVCSCAWVACIDPPTTTPPAPPIDPPAGNRAVEVTLTDVAAGSRVTVDRLTADAPPIEHTIIADGSPITLTGTSSDVFVATIADATGALLAKQAMGAHCAMNHAHRLDVPRDYPTIQAAIDAAKPGDTVNVSAGIYRESLAMRPGICLLGAGAKRTLLDGGNQPRSVIDLSGAPGSLVAGFTIRGSAQAGGCADPSDPFACSGDWYRAGVYLGGAKWEDPTHDAPPVIVNNVFADNDIGVMLYWRGVAVVRSNVFVANRIGLVANHFQDRTLVANNLFLDNRELAIGNQAAYLDLIDNIIIGSQIGVLFQYIQTGHIACNLFWRNGANQADINIVPPRFTIGEDGNVELDPKLVGNGDYHLENGSPAHDCGCHGDGAREVDGTLPDLGVYGGPLATWVTFD